MRGRKKEEITRGWEKLHNEKPHNLHSLPNIIQYIKSKRGEWAGKVLHMTGKKKLLQSFGAEFFWQAENLLASQEKVCPTVN